MARQVFVRSCVGDGIPKVVASSQTVVLGRFVEHVADTTVQHAGADSVVPMGVAFASQARSLFQSDGLTARADGTVYADEYVSVGVEGIFSVECVPTVHGISAGSFVKSAASGKAKVWVQGVDTTDMLIGKAVGDVYASTVAGAAVVCVDVRLI